MADQYSFLDYTICWVCGH